MEGAMSFAFFRAEFMRLYHQGRLADAYDWLKLGGGQFPQQAALLFFWRACILCLLKKPGEAIQTLQDGLSLGYWWAEALLRDDADLADCQGLPEFEKIVQISEACHLKAEKEYPAEIFIYPPDSPLASSTPLMVVLHSRSGNPQEMAQSYLTLVRQGWMVAMIRSSQMLFEGGFTWDDGARARSDIKDMMNELWENFPGEYFPLVASGFSQGGGLAIEIALDGTFPVQGVIAVAPYLRNLPETSLIAATSEITRPRFYLVTGDEDSLQETFSGIENFLISKQFLCKRERQPNLGHDFPLDFEPSLLRGLEFILEK